MDDSPPGPGDTETKIKPGLEAKSESWNSLVVFENNGNGTAEDGEGQDGSPTSHARTMVLPGRISRVFTWRRITDQDLKSPAETDLPPKKLTCTVYPTYVTQNPLFSERPNSFGLHSPDQLPKSESEFRAIASSFGLHSPDQPLPTSENLHPSYNPRLFCDGGLYLDPDIIGKSSG